MKPHKHAELIKAWADGATIQCRARFQNGKFSDWTDCVANFPSWDVYAEYRIKPEPKPDLVRYVFAYASNTWEGQMLAELNLIRGKSDNIKIVFDGETGKPKSVIILN